jgi:peptidoglycan-associated lipoprotein
MHMRNSSTLLLLLPVLVLASCANYKLHKADQAYDRMAYEKAQRLYTKALAHRADRQATIKLADACRRQNELAPAASAYAKADASLRLSGDTALHYGQVLMGLKRMDQAEECFYRVLQEHPEDATALELYGSCQGYRSFYNDSDRYVVNALNLPGITTAFSGIPYKQGILVVGEKTSNSNKANPWNGLSFLDLYYCASKTVVTWLEAAPLPGKVNAAFHEGPAIFTADGRTMYFTRSNYVERKLGKDANSTSHLKLFRASLDSAGEWSDIHSFAHNSEDWSTGHPALAAHGNTLYFASDRPGGFGGSDIWRCRYENSGWSTPENLGSTVNTSGNELFPVINGNALHFSSTSHENMGGLDVFETHEQNGWWSEPINLGYPINTSHDDFAFVVDTAPDKLGRPGTHGYLSSNRDSLDRVYTFWGNEPTFFVEVEVQDDQQHFLPNAEVTLSEMLTAEDTTVMTGADGRFTLALKPNSDYVLRATSGDHLSQSQPISTRGLMRSDTMHVAFRMTGISIDEPIAIDNILYDYDKWDIRADAARELDKLAQLFKDNPHMTFELGAHTDSRGGDNYNLVLSDARAHSAVNYLIQQGVDPDRIAAKGFGETVLVNKCKNGVKCTEEDHQANRRTQFKVTGIDVALKSTDKSPK